MVFILVGSCLGAGLYLAYGYWGNMQLEGLSNRLESDHVSNIGGGRAAAAVGTRPQSIRSMRRQQTAQSVKSVRSGKDGASTVAKSPFSGKTSPFMRVRLHRSVAASCDHRCGERSSGVHAGGSTGCELAMWASSQSAEPRPPGGGGRKRALRHSLQEARRPSRPDGQDAPRSLLNRPGRR